MKISKAEKITMVNNWQQGNQSRKEFCVDNNIKYKNFCNWVNLYSNNNTVTKNNAELANKFIKIETKQCQTSTAILQIRLPNGIQINTHQQLTLSLLKLLKNA